MNQLELQQFRNKVKQLTTSYHTKENVIYLNSHNSWPHERIKCQICYELRKQNKSFVTEAPLKGGKADILVLDDAQIIEILYSETLQKAEWKVRKYPKGLEIIAVTSAEEYLTGNYKILQKAEA